MTDKEATTSYECRKRRNRCECSCCCATMPAVPGTQNMTEKKQLRAMYAEKEETGVSANAVMPLCASSARYAKHDIKKATTSYECRKRRNRCECSCCCATMPAVPGTQIMTEKKQLRAMYAEKEETGVSANAVMPLCASSARYAKHDIKKATTSYECRNRRNRCECGRCCATKCLQCQVNKFIK